jgi:hypothetical protein
MFYSVKCTATHWTAGIDYWPKWCGKPSILIGDIENAYNTNYKAPRRTILSSFLLYILSQEQISSSAPRLKHFPLYWEDSLSFSLQRFKTTGKVIVFNIYIFTVLDRRREDERF